MIYYYDVHLSHQHNKILALPWSISCQRENGLGILMAWEWWMMMWFDDPWGRLTYVTRRASLARFIIKKTCFQKPSKILFSHGGEPLGI